MKRLSILCWLLAMLLAPAVVQAAGTNAFLEKRCLWASINTNANSIYPTGDAEYKPTLGKILVAWRMLPGDTYETGFDLYRQPEGGSRTKVNTGGPIVAGTCYQDTYTNFTKDITYELCYAGQTEVLDTYTITARQLQAGVPYVSVPLQAWEGTPAGFIYKVNDCSYGDLDGDGQVELVLKRGARTEDRLLVNDGLSDDDRRQITHTVVWEAYKLDGTLLWRIFSGPNIETGNSSCFAVYDFDGDGRCEVALRLSEGAIFADGETIGDENHDGRTDYRTFSTNHGHGMAEFLCVVDGQTGRCLDRADYIPAGTSSEAWGDSYWKRANSIRVGVMRCDHDVTSILISRGIYAKTVVEAWDFQGGKLSRRWHFDSDDEGCTNYGAQGYHSLMVCDVDGDGLDEMCYGSMTLNHDGTPRYVSGSKNGTETVLSGAVDDKSFTGYGHGDALHVGDFLPDREGLEIWSCFEFGDYGAALRDANTGETIWCWKSPEDIGKCAVADLFAEYPGCEMWWYGGNIMTADGQEIKTAAGQPIKPASTNQSIWFTGSLNRQLMDGVKLSQHNLSDGKERRPLRAQYFNAKAINGTKENPCLYADLFGDWREEIIYTDSAETCLKIFSTWYPTEYRFPSLLTDHHYEMQTLNQQIGYNQPNETGFYLGSDLLQTVNFSEANSINARYTIYRDDAMTSQVENGHLIAGRTYYCKAVHYSVGTKTFSFQVDKNTTTINIDLKSDIINGIGDAMNEETMDGKSYDLQGRRVGQPRKGQLMVTGGSKYMAR